MANCNQNNNTDVNKSSASCMPFIDLAAQQKNIRSGIDIAIKKVLDRGDYVMGEEVFDLERALSDFCGAKYVVSCANGTDALEMSLMALGVGVGDAVLVPSFTFTATAEVVASVGATPVFIDSLWDSYNIDPEKIVSAIEASEKSGLRIVGLIVVDLFGAPADYDAIRDIASSYGIWIIDDAAQSFGASYKGEKVGTLADISTTSFFPAKPLGCYGDGGAIFTDNPEIASVLRSIRIHGKGSNKYDNVRVGVNSRLDTIQAAILLQKLEIFPWEIEERNKIAALYNEMLYEYVETPTIRDDAVSVWAQYTIRLPESINRQAVICALKEEGVPSVVYYEKPLHAQQAYSKYHESVFGNRALAVCEKLSRVVLSLPMSAYVGQTSAEKICASVIRAIKQQSNL
ncbi:DegT/DnrJ/EryC1/StrS family aminotransferase [Candidatus Hydrogenosomobacter endosymbioticus]|uniref:Aminotransferase DegT n=1 Tax=Candidatus Hydrogenosomobacter endosymbioticus TaxID=2558174 RepID=A0ABN6L2M8_9PROT|nr:DegT/DnrJ/EryC1/StrS aminotransferase family protein [Candidatus Hydrogenosomobacter endosymbioticus]BDB96141.1 aminotransferase DegT [Candidatus Hydrogenosomobacter endosymbioticus]